jgi:hypothetical protein
MYSMAKTPVLRNGNGDHFGTEGEKASEQKFLRHCESVRHCESDWQSDEDSSIEQLKVSHPEAF